MTTSRSSTPRSGYARDGRGRSVKLLDPVPLFMFGRTDMIEPDRLEGVIAELDPNLAATGQLRTRRRFVIIIGSALIGLAVIMMGAIILTGDKNALRTLTQPYFFLPMIGGVVVPFVITRAERMKKLSAVMLNHELCPHCGYDLRGRSRDHDGLTVCPECGCAWSVPRTASRTVSVVTPEIRASNARFKILVAIGLTLFLLGVIAFLIFEFNN